MADVNVVITPTPDVAVEVTEEGSPPVSVTLTPPPEVVEVLVPGPAGPQGEQGEPGPSGGISPHTHTQSTPDTTWTVNHGLGRKPSGISAIDSGNNVMYGGIQHIDDNTFLVTWVYPEAGELRCV